MGWMEKRKENGDPVLVGALVEQVIGGAIGNSSYIVILLSVSLLCFVYDVAAFGKLKIQILPKIKISVISGGLQDFSVSVRSWQMCSEGSSLE